MGAVLGIAVICIVYVEGLKVSVKLTVNVTISPEAARVGAIVKCVLEIEYQAAVGDKEIVIE